MVRIREIAFLVLLLGFSNHSMAGSLIEYRFARAEPSETTTKEYFPLSVGYTYIETDPILTQHGITNARTEDTKTMVFGVVLIVTYDPTFIDVYNNAIKESATAGIAIFIRDEPVHVAFSIHPVEKTEPYELQITGMSEEHMKDFVQIIKDKNE